MGRSVPARRWGDAGSYTARHPKGADDSPSCALLSYGPVPFAVLGPELLADLDKPASAVRAAANY
jgi:hypothetical protein